MRESHPIIAIDGLIFQASLVGGISRVWLSLFQEWAKTDFGRHLLILSRGNTAPIIPSLNYCVIPPSPNDYDREEMERDRQLLQQICDAEGVSLFVSTYYSTPLSTPSVCLLHDMIPEVLQADLTQLVWQEKHQAIRQALSYITVSQNTANDLIKFFPQIPVEKITVAHCGIDKIFKPATYSQIDRFRDKYQIAKPYYLLVGDNRGYKRYLYFFEAFAQLDNHQEFDIVWIGNTLPISPEIQEFMSASTLYSLHVDDDELVSAYSGAIALVYPSIYEGFGLPLLEAIACGCPAITCYNSSIPEVVGDAALFIEATQISNFVEALINVQAPNIRNALIGKGIEHSQHFSWEKMANTLKAKFLQAVEDFEQTGLSNQKIKKIEFCKICGAVSHAFARPIILNKYEVQYYQCSNCGFIQTEDPYWLPEAYSSTISSTDTALVFRNIKLSHIANNLIFEYFNPQGIFLDYGGGYGLFVRLMRDSGYHFYWHDKYCTNLFAHGFEIDVIDPENSDLLELITCFEVFEHLVEPIKEIEKMLKLSKNILFGTQLLPENSPKPADWGYYALNEGQHISIFTRNSLEIIARKFGLNFYSNGSSLHLLTIKNFPDSLFDIPSLYTIHSPRFPSLILSDSSYLSSLDEQSATQEFSPLDTRISENSFIIFPDWTQPLEKLYAELRSVVRIIMVAENCDCFTLLIEVGNTDSILADEILAEVVMSLLIEPDLAFEAEPHVSLIEIGKLNHLQWQVLAQKIRARIVLECESQKAFTSPGITTIPTCKVDELHSLITSLQIGQLNKDLAPISNNLSKEYRVGKYNILLPLDHKLDAYQAKWKRYDLALGYIAQSVFLKYPNSSAIDIGANVGDTAALIRKHVNVPVLCVEGNPQFIEYLRHNTSKIDNITIDVCFIGEDGKSVRAENIVSHSGTASIANSSDIDNNSIDDEIQMKSLKTLISDNLGFSDSKLLKIDTDGYDFLIINESIQTISEFLPVIYFEYDITFQNDGADQGFNTVRRLFDIGYESLIIYDNFGNYLTSISSQQADQRINQFLDVHTYLISNRQISVSPAIFYFDICAFPARDKDIFERIRKMEINQDEILTAN